MHPHGNCGGCPVITTKRSLPFDGEAAEEVHLLQPSQPCRQPTAKKQAEKL